MGVSAPTLKRAPYRAPAVVCSMCGLGPARELRIRRHVGLVVLMRFTKVKAPFCRDHGIIVAKAHLRKTLIQGWWGPVSFFFNLFVIAADTRALRRARRLPFPVGAAPRPVSVREVVPAAQETPEQRASRRSVLRTVLISIGLGIPALITIFVLGSDVAESLDRRLTVHDGVVLTLYAIVGVLATRHLHDPLLRMRLFMGSPRRAIGIGLGIGAAAAVVVVALNSLIFGRLTSDSGILSVFYDARWIHILTLVVVAVVVAPVFEEMLFRGLLLESLRSRGRTSAILGAAVAFAFWHLNPVALRYYVLVGFLLGYLYWRFGLAASISTHAVFNGLLIVAAVLALSIGPWTIDRAGVRLEVPAGWVDAIEEAPEDVDVDVAVESPNGAAVVVQHADGGEAPTAPVIGGPLRVPGAGAGRQVVVAGIKGVRFTMAEDGVRTDNVVLPRDGRTWVVTLVAGGSARAEREFEQMLTTLELYG